MSYLPPPSTLPPGSTVWAYLRDSGGPTQDRSITQQRAVIAEYCQRHGLNLALVYFDVHKSGTSDESREQFHEMISATTRESARPHGLIVWSFARFARNELDAQYYKATLRKRGIVIHSLIDDLPAGKYQMAFEAILDIANAEKAEQASRESKRGLQSIVKQGAMPGTPPRGFKRQPFTTTSSQGITRTLHRWVPDPETAPIVREAFQLRAAGQSLAQINAATHLFSALTSYVSFFPNKLYIGILEFGDLTIPDYCAPIIDRPTWDAVQLISKQYAAHANMRDPRLHPRRVASSHMLSGLCYCARCASPMWGQTSPQRNGSKIDSYRCTRAHRRRDCDLPRIPAKDLEQTVINCLAENIGDPQIFISIQRAVQAQRANWQEKQNQTRRELETRLRGLKRQAENLGHAIGKMGYSATLSEQLAQIELQQQELQLKISDIKRATPPSIAPKTDQQLAAESALLAKIIKSKDIDAIRPIIQAIVTRIDVNRHGKEIYGLITIGIDDDPINEDPAAPPESPPDSYNSPTKKASAVHKKRSPMGAPCFTYSIAFAARINKKSRFN